MAARSVREPGESHHHCESLVPPGSAAALGWMLVSARGWSLPPRGQLPTPVAAPPPPCSPRSPYRGVGRRLKLRPPCRVCSSSVASHRGPTKRRLRSAPLAGGQTRDLSGQARTHGGAGHGRSTMHNTFHAWCCWSPHAHTDFLRDAARGNPIATTLKSYLLTTSRPEGNPTTSAAPSWPCCRGSSGSAASSNRRRCAVVAAAGVAVARGSVSTHPCASPPRLAGAGAASTISSVTPSPTFA